MSSPSAPAAPDYVGAANTQGQANLAAARLNAQLGRVNQVTPFGSLTYSQAPSASGGSSGGSSQIPAGFGFGNTLGGQGNNFFGQNGGGGGSDQWTSTITLAPDQQRLLDAQNQQSLSLANTANNSLSRVSQAQSQPFSFNGQPALRGAPDVGNYQTSIANPNLQGKIDMTGVTPVPSDLSALQKQATDAAMARQNQQLGQQQEGLDARLANQGITPGSDAYNRAQQPLQQARVDATNQAFLTGTQYENQLYNQGLSTNQNQFGQAQAQGEFGNQAAGQQFGQNLAAGQFGNTAQGQQFQNQLQGNTFSNAARGQGIQEQAYLRGLPLNELNALRSGSQVSMPSFGMGGAGGGGGVQPGNYQNAVAQQGQWNQSMYGADVGAYNSQLQGATSLAALGAALAFSSDRRLKRNIKRVGTTPGGTPWYTFEYIWGEKSHGVMADEVPHAIAKRINGFAIVDYAKVA